MCRCSDAYIQITSDICSERQSLQVICDVTKDQPIACDEVINMQQTVLEYKLKDQGAHNFQIIDDDISVESEIHGLNYIQQVSNQPVAEDNGYFIIIQERNHSQSIQMLSNTQINTTEEHKFTREDGNVVSFQSTMDDCGSLQKTENDCNYLTLVNDNAEYLQLTSDDTNGTSPTLNAKNQFCIEWNDLQVNENAAYDFKVCPSVGKNHRFTTENIIDKTISENDTINSNDQISAKVRSFCYDLWLFDQFTCK